MRLALLILLGLPLFGQVRATFEPLAEFEAQRTTGVKNVTLWNVTVNSSLPSVNRGDVERLTDFTELRPSMVEDLIRKASGANGITLAGKTWDQGAPLAGPGLLSWGISASNPWSMGVGAAITLGNIIRGALKGQAPEGFNYIPEFMPDSMPCKDGYCGNWLVMSSKVGKPEKVEVGALLLPQISIFSVPAASGADLDLIRTATAVPVGVLNRDVVLPFVGVLDASLASAPAAGVPSVAALDTQRCGVGLDQMLAHNEVGLISAQIEKPLHGAGTAPIVTHPMVDESIIYDTARIAAMIQERSAARGAVE